MWRKVCERVKGKIVVVICVCCLFLSADTDSTKPSCCQFALLNPLAYTFFMTPHDLSYIVRINWIVFFSGHVLNYWKERTCRKVYMLWVCVCLCSGGLNFVREELIWFKEQNLAQPSLQIYLIICLHMEYGLFLFYFILFFTVANSTLFSLCVLCLQKHTSVPYTSVSWHPHDFVSGPECVCVCVFVVVCARVFGGRAECFSVCWVF